MTPNELKSTVETISAQAHTQVTPDLKKWRERLKLSPEGMSNYLGVPVNTFTKWEKGTRNPPASALALFQVLMMAETLAPALHEALLPKSSKQP